MADERIDRIEEAVRTMAWWLYECSAGFGFKDVQGIERILAGDSALTAEDSEVPKQ